MVLFGGTVWFACPETRGKSLEEIDLLFISDRLRDSEAAKTLGHSNSKNQRSDVESVEVGGKGFGGEKGFGDEKMTKESEEGLRAGAGGLRASDDSVELHIAEKFSGR